MSSTSWPNGAIFSQFKLFLTISQSGRGSSTILYAQPNFFAAFGYTQEQLPMPLQAIISDANERSTTSELLTCLLSGNHHTTYINLVDAHGNHLSCFVRVMAGGCARIQDPANPGNPINDRFTTLTINSASSIGNAQLLGIMVTDPVAQRRLLNERIGAASAPATQGPLVASETAGAARAPSTSQLGGGSSGSNTSTESFSSEEQQLPSSNALPVSTTSAASAGLPCDGTEGEDDGEASEARMPTSDLQDVMNTGEQTSTLAGSTKAPVMVEDF